MSSTIKSPPRTMMEVYQSLPEGTLAELIDNQLFLSPSPTSQHQLILNDINFELMTFFKSNKKGRLFVAPMDVYLDNHRNAVQPDIIVILNENKNIIDPEGHIHGVPDLLVEVLSPGNKDHDLITKKALYEKLGVKEYWIVDPETKLFMGFKMVNGIYHKYHEQIGKFDSELLGLKFSI